MNIIVIGAGRMGQSLAGRLIEEGHSVTVVDWDPNKIEHISTNYDVMALQGNGADYEVLTEAGAEDADLLLAVTSDDAVNMLCCLTARKLGVGNTVARVRTMEYFRQLVFFKEELGLSLVFNPEHDAAAEISRILRIPSAAKVESFAKGRAEMVEFTITAGMPICGMKLSQLGGRYGSGILISAVQRNSDVVIPTGSYTLEAGDVVHVVGAPAKMSAFFKAIGTHKRSVRDVMILGGGRISLYLGRELIDAGIRVKIIEEDEEHCETIKEILPKAEVLLGDGTDPRLLEEEGIRTTDAFVALTGSDQNNIITSMFAARSGAGKVITKINQEVFRTMVGSHKLDSFVTPTSIASDNIVQYVRAMQNSLDASGIESLHEIADGKAEVIEFLIRKDAPYLNIPLRDLKIGHDTLLAAIIRGNTCIIPGGNDVIRLHDSVIAVTARFGIQRFSDIFQE
ncbi:MAG TPA: Trk system potassium transporter TrkA [Candidatus Scatomorpha intestinavium]|mgnify:FL=1|uniref:Trk system potassium uptake protein TrkA n=1 Tax=Candidatus Scatomorpha intestinavium TaxID=2840922 RepID=A0A9D0ZG24_9FIRM|nr:Trk system potassium transporter TrkA [Candidatus Scatomorpha intestinavium]